MPQKPELGRRQYQNGRGDDDDDDDDAGDDDGDDDALVGRGSSRGELVEPCQACGQASGRVPTCTYQLRQSGTVRQTAVQTGSRRPESSASARCPIKYKVRGISPANRAVGRVTITQRATTGDMYIRYPLHLRSVRIG